ncbi:MAG: transcription-repair coupling factor [Eggerthellaceae bacterium]|nr:transcription-repair coupling factor [Eggerthellaceae bacterium]
MLIDSLAYTLERSQALDAFWGKLDAGSDAALAVASSARAFLVAARFARCPQPTLVVIAGEDAAASFSRMLRAYLSDEYVLRFPARMDVPFGSRKPDVNIIAQRMRAAWALSSGKPCIIVASAGALVRLLPPHASRAHEPLILFAQRELSDMCMKDVEEFDDVLRTLQDRGYKNTGELDGPGTFCTRGGVIDVFPGNLAYPIRLDFFGDELEEIRRIVPSTGQTIANLAQVEVFPVVEHSCSQRAIERARRSLESRARTNQAFRELLEKLEGGMVFEESSALLPYLYDSLETLGSYLAKDALSVLIEPRSLFDDAAHTYADIEARLKGTSIVPEGIICQPASLDFGSVQRATYVSIMRVGGAADDELPVKRVEVAGSPEKLFGRLRGFLDGGFTTVLSVPNHRARKDIELSLVDYELPFLEVLDSAEDVSLAALESEDEAALSFKRLRRSVVNVVDVDIPLGMVIPKARIALVSLSDTQGSTRTRTSKRIDITKITFPYKPGDYVVHAAHGVALFKDLVCREIDGTMRDYLLLEYAQSDKLFVPVEQLDRVTRYVGPEGYSPRLTRLNTSDWSRAVRKARKATKNLAFDLVDVYSRRASAQGFRFSPDTPWQVEMEDAFPFEETLDQLRAIADVKADMESPQPMDRLICGDVGFGKTEVAMRAAFKAVQDDKQVMVLCPTTILAQQHYTTFSERCEPFGIRVDVLSRFKSSAQQQETLEGFASGDVHILVGTHRLLSRDVNPHDLGLVIIDEEQRFGVGHKEQFKNLRESVDVLTLSATPIPRTLQMSLSGVRDMSLINTPPDNRKAVKVHVGEWDPDIVSGAIRRELERGGQVYYVSNRVRTIDDAVRRVSEAAGEARIGVAHGKMSKEELERVMEEFSVGELDVLVATTIIESGIDNPHTNTLIIEDSQRLGLAQMYQLKGRVGRSAVQAYAYFMFPEQIPLTEQAQARLVAIDEHQELGSGMSIAMRDLEIRGAGSLLGAEQSGNMSAVGFDLFAQMLSYAVQAAREGSDTDADALPPALSDITVNIAGRAFIPEDFIPDVDVRVVWYRRIASAFTEEDVDDIERELASGGRELPIETRNLLDKARLKAFAYEHGIQTISVVGGKLIIEPVDVPRALSTKMRRYGGRFTPSSRKLRLPLKYFGTIEPDGLLARVAGFVHELIDEDAKE